MLIGLAQVPSALANKKKNIEKIEEVVSGGLADLYVFPELFLTGYMIRDEIYRLAEGLDDESVSSVQKIADEHDAHILFGMPAWDSVVPGVLRNSAVLVSPHQSPQRYDKNNLASFGPFEEKLYFGAGAGGKLMEVKGHKFGVVICYDLFFQELIKPYALAGAESLICLSASPFTSRDAFERLIPVRALENNMHVLYVNNVGTQMNQVFFGGSIAYGPRGDFLTRCPYFEADIAVVKPCTDNVRVGRRARPIVRDSL